MMASVFVALRRIEPGSAGLQMYVVKDRSDQFLGLFRTEQDAINWAKAMGHSPLVVRNVLSNEKKSAEH